MVDNTNRNAETRSHYVLLAKRYQVPIRVFWFTASSKLARHNNVYRALIQPKKQNPPALLPLMAFSGYNARFEIPNEKEEGFDQVLKIHFIFEGSPEEHHKWFQWLTLDGRKMGQTKDHIWQGVELEIDPKDPNSFPPLRA